jgi:hypothetical protein
MPGGLCKNWFSSSRNSVWPHSLENLSRYSEASKIRQPYATVSSKNACAPRIASEEEMGKVYQPRWLLPGRVPSRERLPFDFPPVRLGLSRTRLGCKLRTTSPKTTGRCWPTLWGSGLQALLRDRSVPRYDLPRSFNRSVRRFDPAGAPFPNKPETRSPEIRKPFFRVLVSHSMRN